MRAPVLIAASIAALGLAGCNNANRTGGGVAGICKPFPTAQAATTQGQPATTLNATPGAGDPAAGLDDCLHRWSYTLAASTDPANLVADAALAACGDALSSWNQSALTAANAGGAVQAPSLMTGEPTNPILEHHAFAQGRALFYVVQARAGHCAAPPAATQKP